MAAEKFWLIRKDRAGFAGPFDTPGKAAEHADECSGRAAYHLLRETDWLGWT